MPMDNQLSIYSQYLFHDKDEIAVLPVNIRERIPRIQTVYTLSNSFPWKKDADLVREDMNIYNCSRTQAYEDVRIAKTLLGSVNAQSKEYHRWRFNEAIIETYRAAVKKGDNLARVKALDAYAKYNKLNVEDEAVIDWSRIATQPFTMTDDPSSLGLKLIPNIRQVIADTIAEFSKGDIIDIEAEEVDMTFDPFARSKEDGGAELED